MKKQPTTNIKQNFCSLTNSADLPKVFYVFGYSSITFTTMLETNFDNLYIAQTLEECFYNPSYP